MEKHPLNIFPEITGEDRKRLQDDLKKNRYDTSQPIYIYEGKILDGWSRWILCQELEITPTTKQFTGSKTEAIAFVLRTNKRRNLNSSQWAVIANEADDIIAELEAETQERQKEAGKYGKEGGRGNKKTLVELVPQGFNEANKTRTKLADTFNTNSRYIQYAKKIKQEDPDNFKAIKSGEKTITQVNRERRKKEQKKNLQTKPLPKNIFQVIYADPPWTYRNDELTMSAARQYPTMSTDEICEMNVSSITDNPSICFLWVTNPLLPDGLRVMQEWGFNYKTNIVWIKERHTAGFYVFGKHELLLIGTKGTKIQPIGEKNKSVIIHDKNIKHSKKPEAAYKIIETSYPNLKYIELFARQTRNGWTSWGNEIEKE